MPDRPPVYICAPYAASTAEKRARNVARAAALTRLAAEEGYMPFCAHVGIVPVYGEEETPELREMGLAVDCSWVRLIAAHPEGEFWVLWPSSGSISSGMHREYREWIGAKGSIGGHITVGQHDYWRPRFAAVGLLDRWEACR